MMKKLFGRKTTSPDLEPTWRQDLDLVTLSMDDVGKYCIAAARLRGYPEDSLDMIARRVVFLERRGLPGFAAFVQEMTMFPSESLAQRARPERPDGQKGGGCPIIAAVMMGERLAEQMALPPGKISVMHAPSHPGLMLPKFAEFAGPRGLLAMVHFLVGNEPVARAVMDGHRLAYEGPIEAFFAAEHLGIARFPEESLAAPPLRAGHIDTFELPAPVVRDLMLFLEAGQ